MTQSRRSYTGDEIRGAIDNWVDWIDRNAIEQGFACLGCAEADGEAMEPVGSCDRGQVFAHPDCEVIL